MVWAGQAESPAPVLVSALETSSSEGVGAAEQFPGKVALTSGAAGQQGGAALSSCSVVPARFTWKEAKCN